MNNGTSTRTHAARACESVQPVWQRREIRIPHYYTANGNTKQCIGATRGALTGGANTT